MRAVVKLGGALFRRDPDVTALKEMGKVLEGFVAEGNQLVLVAGGGENARTYISAARKLAQKSQLAIFSESKLQERTRSYCV